MQGKALLQRGLVVVLIILVAGLEPATHYSFYHSPPEGYVPTGLHTPSSGLYLLCMRSLVSGFDFPFVVEGEMTPTNAIRYYLGPVALFFGVLGEVSRILYANHFFFLGWANGISGAFFLWMAWRFFRIALPDFSTTAFILFISGGGLSAGVYTVLMGAGLLEVPSGHAVLEPVALYGLELGSRTSPALMMPYLILTLPLGMGLAALASMIRSDKEGFRRNESGVVRKIPFAFLFATFSAMSFFSPVLGLLVWIMGAIYFYGMSQRKTYVRLVVVHSIIFPIALGIFLRWLILEEHPGGGLPAILNTGDNLSLLGVLLVLLPLLPMVLYEAGSSSWRLRFLGRGVCMAACGFLILYCLLQLDQWLVGIIPGGRERGTYDVLRTACFGLLAGGLSIPSVLLRHRKAQHSKQGDWFGIAFWLLLASPLIIFYFLPVEAMPKWLDASPDLILPFMGVLAAGLGARALHRIRLRWAVVLTGVLLMLGLTNILVTYGYYKTTPSDVVPVHARNAIMRAEEATLLDSLPEGRVLPGGRGTRIGSLLALRSGNDVAGARTAVRIGGEAFDAQRLDKLRFFSPEATALERREILSDWEVDYVYCSATEPVDPATLAALRDTSWLKELASAGEGAVFLVAIE